MKKILLLNRGYSDNFGDQAIKISMEKLIFSYIKNKEIELKFYDIEEMERKIPFEFKEKTNYLNNNILKKMILPMYIKLNYFKFLTKLFSFMKSKKEENYDYIVFGGGQLIQNYFPFALSFFGWSNYFPKAKKMILFAGCGNEYNFLNQKLFKKSFEKISTITLRDENSKINLEKRFKKTSEIIPDPVFVISDFYKKNEKEVIKKSVGFAFMNFSEYKKFNKKSTEDFYNELCLKELNKEMSKNKKVFLFYTTISDIKWNINFQNYLISKGIKDIQLIHNNNFQEFLKNILKFEKIISNRMHALIIAYSYKIPIEIFITSNKLKGFEEELKNLGELKEIKQKIYIETERFFKNEKL